MYNFDHIINREGTEAFKLEFRELVFGTNDVLPLWVADMDFAAPPEVVKALQERTQHDIFGYTVRQQSFMDAISNWLKNMHQWEIKHDWIEFTPGVLPAIVVTLHEYTKPGDKVIIQTPVYPPFYSIVKDNDRELLTNALVETDGYYTIDFEDLENLASDPKTKVLVLSNPHNPVGRAWTKEELGKMVDICSRNDVLIISDEIHSDLCLFGHRHFIMAKEFPHYAHKIITCMAPSKTFNIAGLSTAYAVITDAKLKEQFHHRLMALQLHMGNLFGGIALEAAYNNGMPWLNALKSYLEENAKLVDSYIKEHMPEVGFMLPEATYLLWLDFRKWNLSPADLKKAMIEIGKVGLNDGVSFGKEGAGFQRLNIASPKAIIQEGLERILKVRNEI